MMYSNKLAVALKHNGKILREHGETVYVEFGSEYSILVKNLNTVKCQVKISIDGKDVGDNGRFIINPGEELDLERSISNGNLNEGNKFKFIERTSAIEQHRGVKLEDGLIKVEFEFECVYRPQQWPGTSYQDYQSPWDKNKIYTKGMVGDSTTNCAYSGTIGSVNVSCASQTFTSQANVNDVGITVPGSKSEQKFQTVSSFITDGDKHVIVLKMLGQVGDIIVKEPITVKTKKICSTCCSSEKHSASFCSKCGTSLNVI